MDITLDSTDKLISVILGGVSLLSVLLRKILWPKIKRGFAFIKSLKEAPLKISNIEMALQAITSLNLAQQLKEAHTLAFTSKHKADFLLNESHLAIYECDINGSCVFTNQTLQNLFGLNNSRMLGDGWLSALHPDDIVSTHAKWQSTVRQWVPYRSRYRVINQITNQTTLCESFAVPIRDNDGIIISYLGVIKVI